jgi:endonuclease/exonuclease/phosphatase (EEP) superfamily protein YafD
MTIPPDPPPPAQTPPMTRVERTRVRREEEAAKRAAPRHSAPKRAAPKRAAPKEETPQGGRHRRPRGPRRHRRRLPAWVGVIGWIITIPLGVVAFMRFVAWDEVEVFAVLNTVSVFLYLPAWIVGVVAGVGRRYVLAAGALLIVVAQLFIVLPEFTAAQSAPSWAAASPSIKLLDANVYDLNGTSMAGYISEMQDYQPDLVTMEESTPFDVKKLQDSGALVNLPYHYEVSLFNPKAFFVASKYRLSGSKVVYFDGQPLIVETTVALPTGPFPLWVVHSTAPVTVSFTEWKGQLNLIAALVKRRGPKGLLLVGDFNATWGSKAFRAILDAGMSDGAAARGRAFGMTWSQIKHPLPPLVRIDHVLTGPGVAVTTIRTDVGVGSDHRDLMATVAVQKPPSTLLSPR